MLRSAAAIARDGAAQIAAAKTAALQAVGAATADQFAVGEDLSVVDTTNPRGLLAHAVRQNLAEQHAAAIAAAATHLAETDAGVATALRGAVAGLPGVGVAQSPGDGPRGGTGAAPGPPPEPAKDPLTQPDQLPLPTDGATPMPTVGSRDNSSPDISKHLEDNPFPSPLLAGVSAQEWRERLATFKPGDPLPDPRTPTGDKAIDTLAFAAGQQNTTYAWGGNKSPIGPSPGQADDGQGANQFHDWDRIGYDCGGLVRYSVQKGAGFDVGQGTNRIDSDTRFARPGGGLSPTAAVTQALPGDVLVFGGRGEYPGVGTDHTGIYIGNNYMINAPQSGQPVRVDAVVTPLRGTTDILRIPTP